MNIDSERQIQRALKSLANQVGVASLAALACLAVKVEGNSITEASMLRWVNKILGDAGLDEIDREEIQERRE